MHRILVIVPFVMSQDNRLPCRQQLAGLASGCRHSRVGLPKPMHLRLDMLEAMVAGAQHRPGAS